MRRPKARPRTRRAEAERRTAMSRCAAEPGGARSDDAGAEARRAVTLAFLASFRQLPRSIILRTLDPSLRSCCRAPRCSEDRRFSLRKALHSFAERAHAGWCRAVMQAFGQRVGWQSVVSGILSSMPDACFKHTAVPGSKKQSASTPTCKVRATLASIVRSRARPAIMAGNGVSSAAAASSVFDMRAAAELKVLFQLGAHRNRSASRRVGRGGVRPRFGPES